MPVRAYGEEHKLLNSDLRSRRWWLLTCALALAQAAVVVWSYSLLRGQSSGAPAWPGVGVATAIVLVSRGRYWLSVPIGFAIAWLLDRGAVPLLPATIAIVLGQALAILVLTRQRAGSIALSMTCTRDIGALISASLVATLGGAAATAAIGAALGPPDGTSAAGIFSTWFSGSALGAFLVPALAFALWHAESNKRMDHFAFRVSAACVLITGLAVAGFLTPWNWKGVTSVTVVIAVPLVIWTAMKLGARVTLSLVLVLAILATAGTLSGRGAFAAPERTIVQREILVNVYVYISASLSLTILATIAEREAALRRERETASRFHMVLRHSTEGITLYEADAAGTLRCVEVNARTADILFGGDLAVARRQMIGRTREELGALLYTDRVSVAHADALVRAAIESRQTVNETLTLDGPSGSSTFDTSYTPVFDEDGRLTHLLVAAHDVTDRQRAASELAWSEARFRRIFESTVLGVFSWKGSGAITDANDAFLDLLGYTRADLDAGRLDWNLLTPPEFAELTGRKHAEMRSHGHCEPFEKEYLRKDGGRVTVLVAGSLWTPDRDEGFATALDVTSQRQAEHALRSITQGTSALTGEAFFHTLVRELHDVLGAEHVMVARLEGDEYPPLRARTIAFWSGNGHAAPLSYDLADTPCDDVASGEACYFASGVTRLFPNDQALADLRADCYLGVPLIGAEGMPAGILAVMHGRPLDRPDWARTVLGVFAARAAAELQRLQVLEELRASEERLATVFDTVSERLSLWSVHDDGETRLVSFNRAGRTMVNLNGSGEWGTDLVGRGLLSVLRSLLDRAGGIEPSRIDALIELNRASLRQLLETGSPTQHDEIVEYTHGLQATDVEMIPVVDAKGRITHILRSAKDVSERARADTARAALEARERQSQKLEAIGTLAGGIAHDFNNILMGIMGNVELARGELSAGHEAAGRLDEVVRAVHRARNVVRQIVTFSQSSDVTRRPVRVADVVRDTFELLRASVPSTVELVTQVEDAAAAVMAEPGQLSLMLMNVCTNALHAVRERGGRIAIGTRTVTVDDSHPGRHQGIEPGEHVCFTVEDDGAGMTETVLRRIFDPFFTTKPQGEGTGLGLPVVHGIVRAHGGAILVTSAMNVGTRVEIYLPRVVTPGSHVSGEVRDRMPRGRGEHVLLVDDENAIIDVGTRLLRRLGYRVSAYLHPREGLSAFLADPTAFDVVISDLTMPGVTGLELARRIGALRPDVPFILTTGYAGSHLDDVRDHPNIVEVVDKPFDRDTIARTLRAALDRRKGAGCW